MSNDKDAIDRLFKLQTKINMMVMDGTRNAKAVADHLQKILDERQQHLRHLGTVTLRATNREVTLAGADNVFSGGLDGDFEKWGTDVSGEDTEEAKVDVHQMGHDGRFETLFESLGDPRELCMTQGQIVEFCHNHSDFLLQRGYQTFFLFEVNGALFVAVVYVDAGELGAHVYRFSYPFIWDATDRPCLVVKQQTV